MYLKKICLLCLLGMFLLPMPALASQIPKESNTVDIYYKGGQKLVFQNAPYIKDSVVYVSLRDVVTQQAGEISYEAPYIKIKIVSNMELRMELKLIPGQKKFTISKYEEELLYDSELKNDVTYISLKDAIILFYQINGVIEHEIKAGRDAVYIYNKERTDEQKKDFDYSYALSILNQLSPEQNSSVSPESLKRVLAMAANGTQGKTKQQILDILHIKNLDSYNSQIREESKQNKYESAAWESANSIWLNSTISPKNLIVLKKEYQDLVKEYYHGDINTIDGINDIQKINEWIQKNTNDLVQEISIDSNFEIMLLNTAYFKGSWLYPFDDNNTKEGIFNNKDGTKGNANFMSQIKELPYYEQEGLQAVTMKYGTKNGDYRTEKKAENVPFEMTFIIADTIPNSETLNHIYQHMDTTHVQLTLPKFNMKNEIDFKTILQSLGISDLFLPETADFSSMIAEKGLAVTDIKQKSILRVDEKGTEAATASHLSMGRGMVDFAVFKADKPFYFFIRNTDTGAILFEGQYTTATQENL